MIIKSTNSFDIIIDDKDFEKATLYNWFIDGRGYVKPSGIKARRNRVYSLHRFLLDAPEGLVVDHINGNKLDNRRQNLRLCTQNQNSKNRGNNKVKSKGRYKGVRWKKSHNKWQANIRFNGKDIYLGLFSDEREAALIYNEKAKELHGEFAKLNIIEAEGME